MFQKIAKHRANDASNDVHRPPLCVSACIYCFTQKKNYKNSTKNYDKFASWPPPVGHSEIPTTVPIQDGLFGLTFKIQNRRRHVTNPNDKNHSTISFVFKRYFRGPEVSTSMKMSRIPF